MSEPRDPVDLYDKAEKIFGGEVDTYARDVVWLVFTIEDLSVEPYFSSNSVLVKTDHEVSKKMRIDLPVPKAVKVEHIRHLVRSFIRDGYSFREVISQGRPPKQ